MKKRAMTARQMGKIGGKTAAANMTPEERRERALKASQAAAKVRTEKANRQKTDPATP